jgi:hypothetical protein
MASSNASIVVNRFMWLFLQQLSSRFFGNAQNFRRKDLRPAVKTIGSGVF